MTSRDGVKTVVAAPYENHLYFVLRGTLNKSHAKNQLDHVPNEMVEMIVFDHALKTPGAETIQTVKQLLRSPRKKYAIEAEKKIRNNLYKLMAWNNFGKEQGKADFYKNLNALKGGILTTKGGLSIKIDFGDMKTDIRLLDDWFFSKETLGQNTPYVDDFKQTMSQNLALYLHGNDSTIYQEQSCSILFYSDSGFCNFEFKTNLSFDDGSLMWKESIKASCLRHGDGDEFLPDKVAERDDSQTIAQRLIVFAQKKENEWMSPIIEVVKQCGEDCLEPSNEDGAKLIKDEDKTTWKTTLTERGREYMKTCTKTGDHFLHIVMASLNLP